MTNNGEPNWEEIVKIKKPADNKCAHAGCWSEGEMVGFARCMIEKVKPLESKLFHANRIRVEDGMSCINECNALREQIAELKSKNQKAIDFLDWNISSIKNSTASVQSKLQLSIYEDVLKKLTI